MRNFSIKRKLLLASLIVLGLLLFFSGYTILNEKKILIDQARNEGQMINSYLAKICVGALITYDFDLIQSYLVEISENEVVGVSTVYNTDNIVVATVRNKHNENIYAEENVITHPIVSPVIGEIGRIETSLSFQEVNRQIWHMTQRYMIFFIISLCLIIILAVSGAHSITRPLGLLIGEIEKVREGNLDSPVKIYSRDEIGLLGQVFNEMREKLKNTLQELQHQQQDLELLVQKRTEELEESNAELKETQRYLLCQKDEIEKNNQKLTEAFKQLQQSQTTILQQEKLASVGQLAAGVAHEINNPIGFIMSNMSTMAKYVDRLKEFDRRQSGMETTAGLPESLEDLSSLREKLKVDYILISPLKKPCFVNRSTTDGGH